MNETLTVRHLLPAGHVVTKVEATDADDGENARLTYAIINGGGGAVGDRRGRGGAPRDRRPLFIIDETNGDIATSRDIRPDDVGVYILLIAAMRQ